MLVSATFDIALAGILGLLIGSFLNVVIYRLPKMMERQWAAECAELNGREMSETEPFNLMVPRSRCPSCAKPISALENTHTRAGPPLTFPTTALAI